MIKDIGTGAIAFLMAFIMIAVTYAIVITISEPTPEKPHAWFDDRLDYYIDNTGELQATGESRLYRIHDYKRGYQSRPSTLLPSPIITE